MCRTKKKEQQHHHHINYTTYLPQDDDGYVSTLQSHLQLREMSSFKKLRPSIRSDLPDDIILLILSKLSRTASSPSDFITVLLTCKRMNRLAMTPAVLRELSGDAMAVPVKNWRDSFHRFLRCCVHSGNIEAHYLLGMIRFYCLGNRASGTSLMAKAAMNSHAPSLYSLAIIHFNASGKTKEKKDLEAGFVLCARAAFLGSIHALRELGHVLLGFRRDNLHGRQLILQASLRELQHLKQSNDVVTVTSLHKPDAAHRFLREWFDLKSSGVVSGGNDAVFSLCSNEVCGRVETRFNEFRRCAVCGESRYCSRGCQALHWRSTHKDACVPNGVRGAE